MARRGRGRDVIEPPEEEKKNEISYMQPEILPVEIMNDILKQKGMVASFLQKADRKALIRTFYKHITPKFQREYRENRRGKILKRYRQKREKKAEEEDWKKLLVNSKERKSDSYHSSSSASRDRLKPPPSTKSFDEIVIKEHKVRSNREAEIEKDRKRKEEYSHKEVKKIKLYSSSEKRSSDSVSHESEKKIKLKRSSIKWP